MRSREDRHYSTTWESRIRILWDFVEGIFSHFGSVVAAMRIEWSWCWAVRKLKNRLLELIAAISIN
ncbi:hypothetical protein ACMD2_26370 [Ananas comosus]|uniref:Uncharacterized protein n=1 Tax=Ananas comosus TaxID=4615 RepID=A0A199VTL4_ANACO|nr:hypothetical protein ACMD2_26370 [Ananas comosus]